MKYHLAILSKGWSELILDGKKTIESRFSQNRCAPFGKVNKGDVVYLKESGGHVKGMFRVAKVDTYENLTNADRITIYEVYSEAIFVTSHTIASFTGHWDEWNVSNHATLIHIIGVVKFEEPYPLPFRKRDRRAWVVLDAPLHVCEICEDNYLLEVYEDPDGEFLHGSQDFCLSCYARECVSPDEELAMEAVDA